jgi:hypothetical protein
MVRSSDSRQWRRRSSGSLNLASVLSFSRALGVGAALLMGAGCGNDKPPVNVGVNGQGGTGGKDAGSGGAGGGGAGGAGHGGAGGAGGAGGVTDASVDAPGSDTPAGTGGTGGSAGVDASPDVSLTSVTCPTTINGMLETTDPTQVGRESRIPSAGVCGAPKGYPGNGADPTGLHFYDAYHFANTTGAAACFYFTLTYDAPDGATTGLRYLTAYSTYDPANIANAYLGDVGAVLTSPQTMSITVPAGSSIDVVVFAIDVAPNGVGAYTLTCGTSAPDAGAGGSGGADGGGAGGSGGADGGGADGSDGAAGSGGADGGGPGGSDGSDGAAESPDVASDV